MGQCTSIRQNKQKRENLPKWKTVIGLLLLLTQEQTSTAFHKQISVQLCLTLEYQQLNCCRIIKDFQHWSFLTGMKEAFREKLTGKRLHQGICNWGYCLQSLFKRSNFIKIYIFDPIDVIHQLTRFSTLKQYQKQTCVTYELYYLMLNFSREMLWTA